MTKLKIFSIVIFVLLLSNLILIVLLFFHRPTPHGRNGPKKLVIESLHFDSKQIEQYSKLIEQHRAKSRGLEMQIEKLKSELFSTLVSENKIKKDSLLLLISKKQSIFEHVHFNHFLDIKRICKANQMNEYKELTKKMARFFGHKQKNRR